MSSFPYPSGRRYQRKPVNTPATLITLKAGRNSQFGSVVVDTSKAGAKVKAEIRLTPGQMVWIKVGEGNNPSVRCRVVWTRQPKSGQDGEVGLEYLDAFGPVM